MVTQLTKPSVYKSENLVYKLIYPANIVYVLGKEDEEKNIMDELYNISENYRNIKQLLKQKYNLLGRIQTILDLVVHEKVILSDNQVSTFLNFFDYFKKENQVLDNAIKNIDEHEDICEVKKEFSRDSSNFDLIYEELREIINYQLQIINLLKDFVSMATTTLASI